MKFSTSNILISVTLCLTDYLKAHGYDIHYQASGIDEAQTAGLSEPRSTITLVPDFPANPDSIVRLRSDREAEEIVVPALAIIVGPSPRRVGIVGLGHKDYWWERQISVDGFALDEFQHRELADLLHDWLESEEEKEIPVYDFDIDPDNPTLLDEPLRVSFSTVAREELVNKVEAVRYYMRAVALVNYVE